MMVRQSLCLLLALMVAGCASSNPASMYFQSEDRLRQRSNKELLDAYALETKIEKRPCVDSPLKRVLAERNIFTDEQWKLILAGQVRIGEPEALVWVSWGEPDHVNTLTLADGERRALSWERLSSIVYIEDGKVAAILD